MSNFPDKLKAAVCYVCAHSAPAELGSVRLNKILWKSDVYMHVTRGETITGWQYLKYTMGPMVDRYYELIGELANEGSIEAGWMFKGNAEMTLLASKDDHAAMFDDEEREVLDNFINYVTKQHTAASISEESHDTYYRLTADKGVVPFGPVMSEPDDEDIAWAKETLAGIEHDAILA